MYFITSVREMTALFESRGLTLLDVRLQYEMDKVLNTRSKRRGLSTQLEIVPAECYQMSFDRKRR